MLKIAFIINASRKLPIPVIELIQQCKLQPQLDVYQFETNKQKDAIQFAKACTEQQFDAIIAVGGDGTINEVLNGMMQVHVPIPIPILGVIPTGTGNDLVRGLDLKWDLKAFISALMAKETIALDIATIRANDTNYYFLNIADVGFGGKVVQILEKQRKYFGGNTSYIIAILRSFFCFRKPIVSIQADNFEYKGKVMMVAICNGSVFGNGLVIHPGASMNDGILNITLLGRVSLFHYLKNVGKLRKGERIEHPEVKYLETTKIEIKILHGRTVSEMDGEFLDCGDMEVSIDRSRIELLRY